MRDLIKVVIVDDHQVFRHGLKSLLDEEPGFVVIGEAANGLDAVQVCRQQPADVILMDIHMPVKDGIEAVQKIKQQMDTRVLMLTVSEKEADLMGAIEAGADGYLLKNAKPDQIFAAIRNVVMGQGVLSPEVTPAVMRAVASSRSSDLQVPLSRREREVLALLADGATTAKVAAALTISENTAKTHIRRILRKLDAKNRAEAVARASVLGLLANQEAEGQ